MSEDSQVARLLAERFNRPGEHGRIVFWQDAEKQYADNVGTLVGENAANETLRDVKLILPDIGDEDDRKHIPFSVHVP